MLGSFGIFIFFCHHLHSLGDSCLVIMMIFLILFPHLFLFLLLPLLFPLLFLLLLFSFFWDLFYYPHMLRGLVVSRTLHFSPDNLPFYCIQLIPSRGFKKCILAMVHQNSLAVEILVGAD